MAVVKANGDLPGLDLDAAIREAAVQMGENLPEGMEIAIVSVASSSVQFSEYVILRLEAALVSGRKLVVLDRSNLDKIREEQGFQLSGEVDDNSAKDIGKLLGAGAIVTGAFTDLGDVYSLTLKAINIETATVVVSYPADITKNTRIETLLASGGAGTRTAAPAKRGAGNTTGPARPAPAAPAASAYNVGDEGPAGGIVFYDKGNNSGGWRYLEAAPADKEFTATWDPPGRTTKFTMDDDLALGRGLDNTKTIASILKANGGGFGAAAWECDDLVINGFNDWFLPSQTELNYMYGNLHRKGLGGFSGNWYWSSSVRYKGMILDECAAYCVNFHDGTQDSNGDKARKYRVRAARRF
jgi:hypothetical protein